MFTRVAAPSAGGRLLGRIFLTGRTSPLGCSPVREPWPIRLPAHVPSQHGDAGLTLKAPSSWASSPEPSTEKTDTWHELHLRARGESAAAGPAHAASKPALSADRALNARGSRLGLSRPMFLSLPASRPRLFPPACGLLMPRPFLQALRPPPTPRSPHVRPRRATRPPPPIATRPYPGPSRQAVTEKVVLRP